MTNFIVPPSPPKGAIKLSGRIANYRCTRGHASFFFTAGEQAAKFIGRRILFMAAGTWITVGIFGIQIFIWCFYPNELKKWLEKCALGTDRDRGWTVGRQEDELTNALESMGLKEEKKP